MADVVGYYTVETRGTNLHMGILIGCQHVLCLGNIMEEMNIAKLASGDEHTHVDEVEVLERSLGHWHGHIRAVGRIVKIVTSYLAPHMYAPTNELQKLLLDSNACWEEQ
ncbi:hypothetical protein R6Q57_020493 [Mikania cordata]